MRFIDWDSNESCFRWFNRQQDCIHSNINLVANRRQAITQAKDELVHCSLSRTPGLIESSICTANYAENNRYVSKILVRVFLGSPKDEDPEGMIISSTAIPNKCIIVPMWTGVELLQDFDEHLQLTVLRGSIIYSCPNADAGVANLF